MTETISNNEKSFNILNKLILNGFYDGNISPNRIEFERKKFPSILSVSNHRIIGILNDENKFELGFDFKFPLNIAVKIAIGIGIIFSIVSLAYGNWLLPIPFFIVPFLITYIDFKIKKKKEINLLTSNFLELYKSEYE
ncbi:hypothetical protein C7H62_0507 [Mesoflavibacter sp. HG96]|uniref:hypothetical protein n=1 Tax=Mesoflavibacter TaxID=444051 RepID=UPI000D0FEDE3|nr:MULTISPECIES: hypothetical protein [Mesoflavibacter]QIJ88316.1 hypothetical protein C7H62_0507 [Mesoflavibacter sp. HG96]QIJ91044.1 hypothetical protein C7H56_0507 [Mesoflavibacter sp. HG37]